MRHLGILSGAMVVACAQPEPAGPADWAPSTAPVRAPPSFVIPIDPPLLFLGEPTDVPFDADASAGETVILVIGKSGLGAGPCIAGIGGQCLGVVDPLVAGTGTFDATGLASVSVTVPTAVGPGRVLGLQGVVVRGPGGSASILSTPVSVTTAFKVPGCPDPGAVNYDPTANFDDGSCIFSGEQALLVTDTATDTIYMLDTAGVVHHTMVSPVPEIRGIAHDRTSGDGFWVISASDNDMYKLDWAGQIVESGLGYNDSVDGSVRGLDYVLRPGENPVLINVAVDLSLGIDHIHMVDAVTGFGLMEGTHWDLEFLSGYWGIAGLEAVGTDLTRWTTWFTDGTVQLWEGSGVRLTTLHMGLADPYGIALTDEGSFYVVERAGASIFLIDGGGAVLDTLPAPGIEPAGISFSPGPS